MFKKVEVWAVLVLGMIGLVALVVFGGMVRNKALGHDAFGVLGTAAYEIASVPANARKAVKALKSGNGMRAPIAGRFTDRQGWTFDRSTPGRVPDGYLLLSFYDGDRKTHTVDMVDMKTGLTSFSWPIDADTLLASAKRVSKLINFDRWNTERFRAIHPIALPGGDLIFKDHSAPALRISPCGDLVWLRDDSLYHHTTEPDHDGNLWFTNRYEPAFDPELPDTFYDDGIVLLTPEGKTVFERSFADVMIKQGYDYLLFGRGPYVHDPIHLNDVQPVLKDGKYWKKGDVFVSLRNISALALYRPSSDEILWLKQGPWVHQHDVDIIDSHTVAVFDNNHINFGSKRYVDGFNDVVFYDFETDTTYSPYADILMQNDVRTISEGLFSLLPSGHLMVEEENSGRLLIFDADGNLGAEYVNRAEDGFSYSMGWSRFLGRISGQRVLDGLESTRCD